MRRWCSHRDSWKLNRPDAGARSRRGVGRRRTGTPRTEHQTDRQTDGRNANEPSQLTVKVSSFDSFSLITSNTARHADIHLPANFSNTNFTRLYIPRAPPSRISASALARKFYFIISYHHQKRWSRLVQIKSRDRISTGVFKLAGARALQISDIGAQYESVGTPFFPGALRRSLCPNFKFVSALYARRQYKHMLPPLYRRRSKM